MKRLLFLLACIGCSSCASLPGRAPYTSPEALDALADIAYSRYSGVSGSWCLFRESTDNQLPGFHDALRARLEEKFEDVYRLPEDVPDEHKFMRNGELILYEDGREIGARPDVVRTNVVRLHYYQWSGNLGFGAQAVTYRWTGKQWKVRKVEDAIVG